MTELRTFVCDSCGEVFYTPADRSPFTFNEVYHLCPKCQKKFVETFGKKEEVKG